MLARGNLPPILLEAVYLSQERKNQSLFPPLSKAAADRISDSRYDGFPSTALNCHYGHKPGSTAEGENEEKRMTMKVEYLLSHVSCQKTDMGTIGRSPANVVVQKSEIERWVKVGLPDGLTIEMMVEGIELLEASLAVAREVLSGEKAAPGYLVSREEGPLQINVETLKS